MTREIISKRLRQRYGVSSDSQVMDELQDRGLVSDCAVTLEDVADRDLLQVVATEL